MSAPPVLVNHGGILVVRDDLFPGGTKARFLASLFNQTPAVDEVVYASPPEGGAQTALATVAAAAGKKATIFVAKRNVPHNRSLMAKRLGAKVLQVAPGYLTVVQARAKAYCADRGAFLVPFGANMPEAIAAIASAARATGICPDEVWCASGSGVLARALANAWPDSRRFVVQVGRKLVPADVAGARIIPSPLAFSATAKNKPPFPSDPHYDAKAWEIASIQRGKGTVLFWNVTGPAVP